MYSVNQNIKIRQEDGFYIAYDYITQSYYKMNTPAYVVMINAIRFNKIEEIVEHVCLEIGDEPSLAKNDIVEGIAHLLDAEILVYEE